MWFSTCSLKSEPEPEPDPQLEPVLGGAVAPALYIRILCYLPRCATLVNCMQKTCQHSLLARFECSCVCVCVLLCEVCCFVAQPLQQLFGCCFNYCQPNRQNSNGNSNGNINNNSTISALKFEPSFEPAALYLWQHTCPPLSHHTHTHTPGWQRVSLAFT